MENTKLKIKVIKLRKMGKTYPEILDNLKCNIAKSTLSNWCKNIKMSEAYLKNIKKIQLENLSKARTLSLRAIKIRQENKFKQIYKDNIHLIKFKKNIDIAKTMLAIIYLCEGTKKSKSNSSVTLGNSDPSIIKLFLQLLRFCYKIDEDKFRCTVQCRHDQEINKLENFWSNTTGIPINQFYQARIDPRSIGKKSLKTDYKGVCRINYFSSEVFWELIKIGNIICLD